MYFRFVALTSAGSLVRPKVMKSVHYCPATRKTIERKYTDLTSLEPFPTSAVYPTKVPTSQLSSLLHCYHSVGTSSLSPLSFPPPRMRKGIPWRRSLASLSTGTTRQLAFRRCQRSLRLDSCPALSISSWMMILWTSARQEGVEGYLVCYRWPFL